MVLVRGIFHRYPLVVVVVFSLVISLSFQGSRGLYESTEGRYAEAAREMLEQHSYLEPILDGKPHLTKPPLTYWAIAGGMKVLGVNEWGARFFNVLAFVLTVVLIVAIGTVLANHEVGIIAGLIYASSPLTALAANILSTDSLFTLWTVSAFAAYVAVQRGSSAAMRKWWVYAIWISFALGFLTKGAAVLLPLACLVISHCWAKNRKAIFSVPALCLAVVVGCSWYYLEWLRHPSFFQFLYNEQIRARFVSDELHRNSDWYGGFVIYLPMLFVGSGIWLYLVLAECGTGNFRQPNWAKYLARGSQWAPIVIWALFPLPILFLAKSRLPLYVLPFFAPASLMFAVLLYEERKKRGKGSVGYAVKAALAMGLLLIVLKLLSSTWVSGKNMKDLYKLATRLHFDRSTEFVTTEKTKYHGLEFYLQQQLERVSWQPVDEVDGRKTIDDQVRELTDETTTRPHIIFVKQKESSDIKSRLIKSGLHYRTVEDERWVLFAVKPGDFRHDSLSALKREKRFAK